MSQIKRIILHIGRHKSGTSALQHYLTSIRESLDRQGILYPRAGTGHHAIAHHNLARLCDYREIDGLDLTQIITSLSAEIQPHHHTLLFSSEEFQNLNRMSRIRQFVRSFPNADVEIICYVREYADYLMSSFRQAVQNQGKFQTFTDFTQYRFPARGFIRRWRGIGRINFGWFHPNLLLEGDIIHDFFNKTGLSLPHDYETQQRNPSLGGNLLWMKLSANRNLSLFLPYKDLTGLMQIRPEFTRYFRLSDRRANALRAQTKYNKSFSKLLGPVPMTSWEDGANLPNLKTFEADMAFIREHCDIDLGEMNFNPTLGHDWF